MDPWGSVPLADVPVVAIDCQATSSSPSADPIEVAWCALRAGAPPSRPVATLVALPPGAVLPPRVARLTGIDPALLVDAPVAAEVGQRLLAATTGVAAVVAHVARFEQAMLPRLAVAALPVPVLCTHRIARHLLPDLPSRSLRALAGYFGHATEEARRSAEHVAATAVVWRELVSRLPAEGVRTLGDLAAWLERPPRRPTNRRTLPLGKFRRLRLPRRPGVYRMKDATGRVLYVGKARDLRRRVNGYFQKALRGATRHAELLVQVKDVEVTATATDVEASLLEIQEIQRLDPPYNVALRRRPARLLYATRDLSHLSEQPDDRHVLGPFPDGDAVVLLAATTLESTHALAAAAGWPPPQDALGAVRLGRRLARRAPDAAATESTTPVVELADGAVRSMALAGLVAAFRHAALSWVARDATRRLLAIEDGAVVTAKDLPAGADTPGPAASDPGTPLTPERYQVLRVLAAEWRRLAAGGQAPILRPRAGRPIRLRSLSPHRLP